jgi:beta-lactamase regulating signal transducer with metallopeptidase domain
MIGFVGLQSLSHLAMRLLPALLGSALRASMVFALVCTVTNLMKNTPPRPRHLLWLSALLSYPVILVLLLLGPYVYLEAQGVPAPGSAGFTAVYRLILQPIRGAPTALSLTRIAPSTSAPPASDGSALAGWRTTVLLVWVAGAWLSYSRVIVGKVRLRSLKSAAGAADAAWETMLRRDVTELHGVLRNTRILTSSHSHVPFTCGLFRPLIVLPKERRVWSQERLRAVLHHELSHVRRRDLITQEVARVVCSLFWFVPFVWIAYRSLYLEQEKACDLGVVERGVERRRYAACLLEAARLSRDPVHLPGLVFPRRRKQILEERIRSIVIGGGMVMKSGKAALGLTAAAICVVALASCVHIQRPIAAEKAWERFAGTWVNQQYSPEGCNCPWVQKIVIRANRTGEDWTRTTDTDPTWLWKVESIKKTWTDWRGRTYCQYFFRYPGRQGGVGLLRVSRSGKVLELNSRSSLESGTYPEEIDPKATPEKSWYYFIYHRE